ncbi:DUF2207 domain-containing protein [Bacillus infantis]|uniref:phage tail protein n=1 Tax=Bacillus infantis TaxID=324767 RepID=UPI003CF12B41
MARDRIKGITVEIGGDTVGLQNALRDVNRRTKDVQSELKDVQRLLKFDPNNVELLAQRQELLTQAIQSSTDKLNQLRQAEAQVQAQFERGEISQEQYRGFRRELQQTEQELQGFQQALQDLQDEQEQVGQRTRQMNALFDATGTSVEDYAGVIGTRLVRAIQNGTATSRDLEYAFQRIGRQAIGSGGDIDQLRATLATVDSGNSIQNIRRDLQQLQSEADEAAEAVEGVGIELENVAGALVAGGGISGAIDKALESSSVNTQINIALDVDEDSLQTIKSTVGDVTALIEDQEAALSGTRRLWMLNKDASDEVNASIAKGAGAISFAFKEIDFNELIQESYEIGKELNISQGEAIALVDSLLKAKFPPDQLDIIAEYGAQLSRAGYNAEEIRGIMAAGVDTGTWNIDVLLDGLKEGRIGLAEFGQEVDDAAKEVIKGTDISAKQLQEWGKAVAAGGNEGKLAMLDAALALDKMEEGAKKNQVGVKLFGTLYEENGVKITDTILGAKDQVQSLDEMQKGLNDTLSQVQADPLVAVKTAFNDLLFALQPVFQIISDLISKIAEWISENPKLAATITAISTALGIIIGVLLVIGPILAGITAATGILSVSFGTLVGIISGVVAGIAALIAISVLLYKNWDEVKSFALSIWSEISQHFGGVIEQIKGYVLAGMNYVKSTIQSILSAAVSLAKSLLSSFAAFWKENGAQITAIVKGAMTLVASLISGNLQYVKGVFQAVMPIISGVVKIAWGVISATTKSTVDFILGVIQFFLKIFKGDWSGAFQTIKDTTQKIWSNIVNTFKGINLRQIGKDIVQGLINGITSMASGVWNAVKSIGNSIKDVFTSMFDIHSPSRVFEGYGVNINEGLIRGIKDSARKLDAAVNNTYGNLAASAKGMLEVETGNKPKVARETNTAAQQPLSIVLNYTGNNINDAYNMVDIIESELGSRATFKTLINGVNP